MSKSRSTQRIHRTTIPVNAAKCKHCGDIIVSKHQHDFVRCKCGLIAVDGGSAYRKRCYPADPPEAHYDEIFEMEDPDAKA